MKLALDIGCGSRKLVLDGYDVKTLDVRESVRPDFVGMFDKIKCPDETFDMVHASHVLEHVKRDNVYNVLKEWRRILRPLGELRIVVPDLEVAAIELLSCQTSGDTFDILWGAQDHEYNIHYSGYTKNLLVATLCKYGFRIDKLECKDRCIFCSAIKTDEVFI